MRRTVRDLRSLGIRHLPKVARELRSQARPPLRNHRHPGRYELVYLARGEQSFAIQGVGAFALHGGQALLTHPDEVHSSGWRHHGDGDLWWCQIAAPGPDGAWLGLDATGGRLLHQRLRRHHRQVVRIGTDLVDPFSRLLAADAQDDPDQLCHLVHRILYGFLAAPVLDNVSYGAVVRAALAVIDSSLRDALSVPQLAGRLGVSPGLLTRHFRQELGATPAEYIRRRRIELAEQMLSDGRSVTDVAHQLGFCSSQHFATVYRRYRNRQPRSDRPVVRR